MMMKEILLVNQSMTLYVRCLRCKAEIAILSIHTAFISFRSIHLIHTSNTNTHYTLLLINSSEIRVSANHFALADTHSLSRLTPEDIRFRTLAQTNDENGTYCNMNSNASSIKENVLRV